MEKHGACKGGLNQELHVQVLHCINRVFCRKHTTRTYLLWSGVHKLLCLLDRLAQAVLAREEPEETFLKSIPQDLVYLQIIHPVSVCPFTQDCNRCMVLIP